MLAAIPMHMVETCRFNVLHRIIDRHAGGHRTAGAVDIYVYILIRIFCFQK